MRALKVIEETCICPSKSLIRDKIAFLKVVRNSFVGRAQTGFQFARETKKEQTKMASRSRLDLIFCAGLLKAGTR